MYLMEKIEQLFQRAPDSVDGRIAFCLLQECRSGVFSRVKDFIRKSSVSRASLHRFVSEGGFCSWNDLIRSLEDDLKRNAMPLPANPDEISVQAQSSKSGSFLKNVSKPEKAFFYGDFCHLPYLEPLFYWLRKQGCVIEILNIWNLADLQKRILDSSEQDLLFLFELNMRTDTFLEFSLNRPYLLAPQLLKEFPGPKFHITLKRPRNECGFEPVFLSFGHQPDEMELLREIIRLTGSFAHDQRQTC